MNPLFRQLYKHKKTRARDPNAPPPPNLFSTVRDLKLVSSTVDTQANQLKELESRVQKLEARNRYLENYVDYLRNKVSKR